MNDTKLTEKETMVMGGMMLTSFEQMGGTKASDLLADNFSWNSLDDLEKQTGLNRRSLGGVLGSLTKKGMVGKEFSDTNKTNLFFFFEKGIDFLVKSGC